MNADSQKVRSIFLAAIEGHTPDGWDAYLDEACPGDPELRRRVKVLLRAHERPNALLDESDFAPDTTIDTAVAERPGTTVGQYKLLEQIGEGGFGVVFMAEQNHPVRRKVALKVLKPGMDSRQVVARFEAERQALALMDHPNIAHVFDGGETSGGRPYFVMELVRGIPVTDFCDQNHLSVNERLELFISVCQAVQHAHQKGLIHRDLKPSNLLVTMHDPAPVVKVIDFGIAKATGQQLTDKTLFTNYAQFLGTPLYMSPEQAQMTGLDIDTRADIYSLGVVLYELLTGTTPFDRERLKTAGYDEIRRIIREEEPAKPSTRLSTLGPAAATISADRKSDPKRLSQLFRGELDWVVMKALEKDRNRRYESASAFAADVQRYLNDEPVQACPPSAAYRFGKFARRNKIVLTATSAVAAALLIGTGVAVWQAAVATRAAAHEKVARETAQTRAAETLAVLNFVEKHIFAAARPKGLGGGLGREVTLRQAVESALQSLDRSFTEEPLIEARLRMTLGQSFYYLGNANIGLEQSQKARTMFTQQLGPEHTETLRSMLQVANGMEALGRSATARDLREETLVLQRRTLGEEHPDTLMTMNNLANSYGDLGLATEALQLRAQTLVLNKRVFGANAPETLGAMNSLSISYFSLARHQEALELREQTFAMQKAHPKLGPNHPDTLTSMHNVGNSLHAVRRHADALPLLTETVARYTERLGADHPDALLSKHNLANVYVALDRHDEALKLREETLAARRAHPHLGPDHPDTLKSMSTLASSYHAAGRLGDALPLHEETVVRQKRMRGPDHPETLGSMFNLANTYHALGRHPDALKLREETLELRRARLRPNHPDTLRSMCNLAMSYNALRRHSDACELRIETLALRKTELGLDHVETLESMRDLAVSLLALDRGDEAVPLIDECVRRSTGKDVHRHFVQGLMKLRLKHFEKARDLGSCRATAEMWEKLGRTDANGLYTAAIMRAGVVAVIRATEHGDGAATRAEAEANLAMSWLRKAVAVGPVDPNKIEADDNLSSLRDRPDFKKLMADLKK